MKDLWVFGVWGWGVDEDEWLVRGFLVKGEG